MLSTPLIRGIEEIGPYQVLEDLGPAPFGTAHLALDSRNDRVVVLKAVSPVRPGRGPAAPWEILLAETRALCGIYHRGVPATFEIAEAGHEGALLVSFAPTEGRTLREALAQGKRPDRALLAEWGCQLLDVLAEVHGAGILHRHLSEDEVVLTPAGWLTVTGFGLTQLVGAPAVAVPPEALDGGPCTPQSDLYAVGMLLRRLAFAGAFHRRGERDPLLKVLARATCPEPRARFGSAGEMAEALREAARAGAGFAGRRAGRTAAVPEPPLRLSAPLALPPRRPPEKEDGDLWRILLLLGSGVVLLAFVLIAGWLLIGEAVSGLPKQRTREFDPGLQPPTDAPSTKEELPTERSMFVHPHQIIKKLQKIKPLPPGSPFLDSPPKTASK